MSPFAQTTPVPTTPLTIDALIDVRESARALIAFIDGEIQARCDEDEEAAEASADDATYVCWNCSEEVNRGAAHACEVRS